MMALDVVIIYVYFIFDGSQIKRHEGSVAWARKEGGNPLWLINILFHHFAHGQAALVPSGDTYFVSCSSCVIRYMLQK